MLETTALIGTVLRDHPLQIGELRARQQADLANLFKVLLRTGKISDHEIGLANVFVRDDLSIDSVIA